MTSSVYRRIAMIGAVAAMAAAPLGVPAAAHAAPLSCRASMSDKTPEQYSDVVVRVKTAPKAKVRTVAHYKTTNTTKRTRANQKGRARTTYYISSASAGYKVKVDVTVKKKGRTRTCSKSFVPQKS